MPKLIIIEPNLKNQDGHYYQYIRNIQSEFVKKDFISVILCNTSADSIVRKLPNCIPCFKSIGINSKNAAMKILKTYIEGYKFFTELKIINSQQYPFIDKDNHIFLDTVLDFQIIGWAIYIGVYRRLIKKNSIKIIFFLRFRLRRNSQLHTIFNGLNEYLAIKFVKFILKENIYLVTDSHILSSEYKSLIEYKLHVLPIPIKVHGKNKLFGDERSEHSITYIGGINHWKGFDLFISLCRLIINNNSFNVNFNIQADINEGFIDKGFPALAESVDWIRRYNKDNLKVVDSILDTDDYWSLLRGSDLLVLPYRGEHYVASTSGVFAEALCCGVITIVPENTWMSHELNKLGMHDTIYIPDDLQSLVSVTGNILLNFDSYQKRFAKIMEYWREFHSVYSFVDNFDELLKADQ